MCLFLLASGRPRPKQEAETEGRSRHEQGVGMGSKRPMREKLKPAEKEMEIETGDAKIGSVRNRPKREPRRRG